MPEPTTPTDPQSTPQAPAQPTPGTPPAPGGQPPQQPPAAIAKPEGVSDAEWAALGDPGKAAIVREREAAAQAKTEVANLRKQIEDAAKTAEQRAADDLRAAQTEAAQSAAKALRYEVAAEKGIPLNAAGRLVGTTREEIAADADRFLAEFPGLNAPSAPRPDPSQGAARSGTPGGTPEGDFAAFLSNQLGQQG